MARVRVPRLRIVHRQRQLKYDRDHLEFIIHAALPLCTAVARRLGGPLGSLDFVEVSVVGERSMARLHRAFFHLRGATDVITFPYGEIIICATVAAARAQDFGNSVTAELALYAIHGLLHLAGHNDLEYTAAARMACEQERILHAASVQLC